MAKCDLCGNEYRRSFTIEMDGEKHVFDSFECAIEKLAPRCDHCHCRIIGHGMEAGDRMFCCAHCARESGVVELKDQAGAVVI